MMIINFHAQDCLLFHRLALSWKYLVSLVRIRVATTPVSNRGFRRQCCVQTLVDFDHNWGISGFPSTSSFSE